jgi:hypothetical protein
MPLDPHASTRVWPPLLPSLPVTVSRQGNSDRRNASTAGPRIVLQRGGGGRRLGSNAARTGPKWCGGWLASEFSEREKQTARHLSLQRCDEAETAITLATRPIIGCGEVSAKEFACLQAGCQAAAYGQAPPGPRPPMAAGQPTRRRAHVADRSPCPQRPQHRSRRVLPWRAAPHRWQSDCVRSCVCIRP